MAITVDRNRCGKARLVQGLHECELLETRDSAHIEPRMDTLILLEVVSVRLYSPEGG